MKQFLECAELDWLRMATVRHHNRLAAPLAQCLGLVVRFMHDVETVAATSALLPTTSCISRDLSLACVRVALTSEAVLLERCKSGVVFDCFAGEGFWVFMGPCDSGSCNSRSLMGAACTGAGVADLGVANGAAAALIRMRSKLHAAAICTVGF